MSKLKVAVIGAGPKGREHAQVLSGFPDVVLTAVCDPQIQNRESLANELKIPHAYACMEEMLSEHEITAVFLATPPHLNASVARSFLERGVHTMIEKPAGMTAAETMDLRDTAATTGRKAMIALNRRFNPIIVRAWEMVKARGPVVQLVGEFHKGLKAIEKRGKYGPDVLDNFLMSNDIHAIDVVRFMAGSEPLEVHSYGRRVASDFRNMHAALVRFENDVVANLAFNYTTDSRLERYEIHGMGISAYLEGVDRGVVYCDGDRLDLNPENCGGAGGTEQENRFFVYCVKNDRDIVLPAANLDEALKSARLVERIRDGLIDT